MIHQKKPKGFIMTLLLLNLPVFILCLMVLATLIFCIRNYNQAQSYCLKYSLQAQENIKVSLKKLLSLNSKAKMLRNKYKKVKKLYRKALAVGEPISVSILKAKLSIIQQKRRLLDARQKQILRQSRQHIERSFESFRKKVKKFQAEQIQKKHHYPFPIAVSAYPKMDIAPQYRPMRSFSLHQTLSFSWKMPLYYFLPSWLTEFFFEKKLSSYHCSATIKKYRRTWKTTLTTCLNCHSRQLVISTKSVIPAHLSVPRRAQSAPRESDPVRRV